MRTFIDSVCTFCQKEYKRDKYSKGKPFCTTICQGKFKYNKRQEERRVLFKQGKLKYRRRIRVILLEMFGHICQICKHTEWNGQKIPLQVDHKDGCSANNSSSNLRLICHNCDAQLPTFAGKNRGKGRKAIGLKSYE